jgi:putative aldouronate transport system substrate-binding protein
MKKRFSILLAVVLLLSIASSLLPGALAEAAVAPSGASLDYLEPFAERVSITVPVYDRGNAALPPVDDNYWTQWVQKEFGDKYNVDVQYVPIPRNDVMTAYSLLIAAGDNPTIMMEYDYPKVAQWAGEGAMQPIDLEAFKAVAPTFYQAMVDNNHLGYTDINGSTYFVLTERPYYNATTYPAIEFVRKDWLDQLGLSVPTTYEEYLAAAVAVKEAGIAEYPLGLGLPMAAYVQNFGFRNFPVDEKEWVMHSSLGTPSLSWYPTERFLRRQNAEYNLGLISPEFELEEAEMPGSASGSQWQTDFINGKKLWYSGYITADMPWLKSFYEVNPDAELAVMTSALRHVEPGVAEPAQLRADNPFGMIVGFSALATPDQLKAAWMLMEWMIQPETLFILENGIEGVTYTIGEDGLPVLDPTYTGPEMLNHNANIDMACLIHASKTIGTLEQILAIATPKGIPQDFTQQLLDDYAIRADIAEKGQAYSDPIFAVAIDAESEYTAALLSLYQEYSVRLTKCAPEEFDALYAELSQAFLDAGYQEVIDERLAAYEAGMTTKLPAVP